MNIQLINIGKRFNRNWIFRGINIEFEKGRSIAILGGNGSGKSTLLQLISGFITPSEGTLKYILDNTELDHTKLYRYLSVATPYTELLEDLTLEEQLNFHFRFKSPLNDLSTEEIMDIALLKEHRQKEIKFFSSGMKQRLRLALAILSESHLLLLDEPTSHLDEKGKSWYNYMIKNYLKDRLVFISSNQPEEIDFCEQEILIENYKK